MMFAADHVAPHVDAGEVMEATHGLSVPTRADGLSITRREIAVVAIVLECQGGRVALMKRSDAVGHDKGRWHCITGYLERDVSPQEQALIEMYEETGLRPVDLVALDPGEVMVLFSEDGRAWRIHTFKAVTHQHRLRLNWEHDEYRWTPPSRLERLDGQVEWLGHVLAAVSEAGASKCPRTFSVGVADRHGTEGR